MSSSILQIVFILFLIFITSSSSIQTSPIQVIEFQSCLPSNWTQDAYNFATGVIQLSSPAGNEFLHFYWQNSTSPRTALYYTWQIGEIQTLNGTIITNISSAQLTNISFTFTGIVNFGTPLPYTANVYITYCGGASYSIGYIIFNNTNATTSIQEFINCSYCTSQPPEPVLTTGRVAMVPDGIGGNAQEINDAFRILRNQHVQLVHVYLTWSDVEINATTMDWISSDYTLAIPYLEGFEISVVIEVISSSNIGSFPSDLVGKTFGDSVLQQRFINFVGLLLARYPGVIKYLEIGNEINLYFNNNQSQIPYYYTFLENVVSYIKTIDTNLMVGTIFAYAGLVSDNSLLVNYSQIIDFMGYTIYVYGTNFNFSGNVSDLKPYIDGMVNQSAVLGKPFGIVEIGENSNTTLGSSYQHQADFVNYMFQLLNINHDKILFLAYFIMNDFTYGGCVTLAADFYPGYNTSTPEYINFVAYLCGLGLYSSDGTPKVGWYAYINSTDQYIENVTGKISESFQSSIHSHKSSANEFFSPISLIFLINLIVCSILKPILL